MSYILDALRRADAERERGHVPGLHTHRASAGVTAATPPPWRASLIGLGVGSALVLVALGVWHVWATPSAVPAPVVVTPAAPVVASVASPPSVPAPAIQEAPTTTVQAAPALPSSSALTTVAEPVAQAPAPAPASRKRATPAAVPPEALPRTATAATVPASAPAAAVISTLAELPDDIRRQLPALAVGGSAYSTSAASRFVIVNGQLFHEGDALAPGLVLEQIRLKSAVLAFKGYRYGINF